MSQSDLNYYLPFEPIALVGEHKAERLALAILGGVVVQDGILLWEGSTGSFKTEGDIL